MLKLFEKKGQPGVLCDAKGNVLTQADIKRLSESAASQRTLIEESSPLGEFSRLAEGTGVKPDAPKELVDAWLDYGLSPEAAAIAAGVQTDMYKDEKDIDWANL
jgi:hypothetical protein